MRRDPYWSVDTRERKLERDARARRTQMPMPAAEVRVHDAKIEGYHTGFDDGAEACARGDYP